MYKIGCSSSHPSSLSQTITLEAYLGDVDRCFDEINLMFTECIHYQDAYGFFDDIFEEKSKTPAKPVDATGTNPKKENTGLNGMVAKIGKKIRELIEKLKAMVKKIKDAFFKSDREAKKLDDQIKKELDANPDLRKQIIDASNAGIIDLRDMKDLNQFHEECDKLLAEKNPKTLKGKFEKLKRAWDDPENAKTVKRIKVVGTCASVVASLLALRAAHYKFIDVGTEHALNDQNTLEELDKFLKSENINKDDLTTAQLKTAIIQYRNTKSVRMETLIQQNNGKIGGLFKRIMNTSDEARYSGKKGQKDRARILNAMDDGAAKEHIRRKQDLTSTLDKNIASLKGSSISRFDKASQEDLSKIAKAIGKGEYQEQIGRFVNQRNNEDSYLKDVRGRQKKRDEDTEKSIAATKNGLFRLGSAVRNNFGKK